MTDTPRVTEPCTLSSEALDRLHEAMAAHVAARRLPGLVTLVAAGDEVAVDAIGHTAFDGGEPMTRSTIFRIASLTKPVVATATMMMVDDGSVDLDQPVDEYLPELAGRRVLRSVDAGLDDTTAAGRPITVEDLLTFRMGYGMIVEPEFEPPYPVITAARDLDLVMAQPDPRTPHRPDEWIKRFGTLPLMHEPGTHWHYNASALVLGVLLARVAGTGLDEVLRSRVFEPLGMRDTGFWLPADRLAGLPAQYMTNFGTGVMEEQTGTGIDVWTRAPAFPSAAAGLLSTVDDYFTFARFLRAGGVHGDRRLLSGSWVTAMTTNHLTPDQIAEGGAILGGRGWGYGMSVAVAPDTISRIPGRYGWEGGYGTSWFNDPASDVTAILMSQTSDVLFDGTLAEFGALAIAARRR